MTTNCGGMKELVTDNESGFVVPVRDPKAISIKVQYILEQNISELNKLRNAAFIKAKEQHSEEKMVSGMLQMYNQTMKEN